MKKVLLSVAVIAALASFSSCKKDYTCTCNFSGQTFTYELKDLSKSDAETACDVYSIGGYSCSLD
jgi:hypothetical protein